VIGFFWAKAEKATIRIRLSFDIGIAIVSTGGGTTE
jgi:hypothetical protein